MIALVTDFLALIEEPEERRHDCTPITVEEARHMAHGLHPVVKIGDANLNGAVRKSLGLEDCAGERAGIVYVRDWQYILVVRFAESPDFGGSQHDDPYLRFTLVSKAQ